MTLLSALCCPLQTPAKADALVPAEVVQWTQSHVYPLHVSTADSSFGLAPLAHVLGHARVIGLGEADHGLHEFFAFRNLFFQYGVEKLGVTAIAAETGVTESFAADDYVLGRRGFDRAVADSVFSWSAVAYEENRALLDWMRSYNALPSTTRKLHFYGIDLTGGRGGRFVEARLSLDAALDYAAPLEATQIASIRSRVAPLEARFATGAYDSLSAEQQATLTTAIDDLVSLIERRSAVWPARTSVLAFNRALDSALVARQLNSNFRSAAAESNPQAQRESAMAENLVRILDRQGEDGRVLLYAANWHISKGPMATDRFGSSLGEHLDSLLGSDYVALAMSFGRNTVTAEKPDPQSTAALLRTFCMSTCWIDFQAVPKQRGVDDWFHVQRAIQAGRVDHVDVIRAFNAQIFFPESRPAAKL